MKGILLGAAGVALTIASAATYNAYEFLGVIFSLVGM